MKKVHRRLTAVALLALMLLTGGGPVTGAAELEVEIQPSRNEIDVDLR